MVVSDYFYSRACRNVSSPNMEIWKDVMEGKASAELLICGDSRANTDCYPPVIDSITGLYSYSIGVIGHHFRIGKLRYDMYRKFNDKPLVVVQFVDNWTFSQDAKFDPRQFLPWMWNWDFTKDAFRLAPRYFLAKAIPWFRYHGFLLSESLWSIRMTLKGFHSYDDGVFTRIPEGKLRFRDNPAIEKMFRSFVSETTNEGIKLVLVLPPFCGSCSFKESSLVPTRERFSSIAREYGIPLLDYLQVPAFEDSSMFIDSVHLNKMGAKVFSDTLAHDIMRLGLLNN